MFKSNKHKRSPEDEKIFLMWTGVCFFMVLVVSLWIFNMKNIFSDIEMGETKNDMNISTMTENLEKSMDQIKNRLNEVGVSAEDTVEAEVDKN